MIENNPSTPTLTKNNKLNLINKLKKHPKVLAFTGLFLVMFLVGVSLALVQSTKKNTDNRSQASGGNSATLSWATHELTYIPNFVEYNGNTISEAMKNICIKLDNPNNVVGLSAEVEFDPSLGFIEVVPNANAGTIKQASKWYQSPGKDKVRFFIGIKPGDPLISTNGCIVAVKAWARKQEGNTAPAEFKLTLKNFQVVHKTEGVQTGRIGLDTINLKPSNRVSPPPQDDPTNTPTITPTPILTLPAQPPRDLTPSTSPEPTVPVSECELPAKLDSLVGNTSGLNAIFTWRTSSACNTKINQDQAYVWWQIIDLDNNKERIASSWNPSGSNLDNNRVLVNCENRNNHHLRMDAFISEIGKGYTSYNQSIMRGKVKSANIQCP